MKSRISSKAQVSMEIVLIFSFVILIFITFMNLINNQFSEVNEEKDFKEMQNLAELIRNEVVIASQVHNNYIRKFKIPSTINQNPYNIILEKDLLVINISNEKQHLLILPINVKGSFTDEIKIGELDHCITKTISDGIRISKNQASIELNITQDTDNDGIVEIGVGEDFFAYLRINCVENIKGLGVTLRYDPEYLTFLENVTLYQKEDTGEFSSYLSENPFIEQEPKRKYHNANPWYGGDVESEGTIKLGYLNSGRLDTGSGNIFRMKFMAKATTDETLIEFDPDAIYATKLRDLEILGVSVTKQGALPKTKINTKVEIT